MRPPAPPAARRRRPSTGATAAGSAAPGGSGRELCWFPDPIGGRDCYRAALPDALLLVAGFPGVGRVTARLAATRRDRLTARLPMLRPPHPEGGLGAVRVEVRGRRGGDRDVVVLGAMDRPAVAARCGGGAGRRGSRRRGELAAPGPAAWPSWSTPVPFLAELARRGVRGRGVPAGTRRRPGRGPTASAGRPVPPTGGTGRRARRRASSSAEVEMTTSVKFVETIARRSS